MHEMGITRELVDTVVAKAEQAGASKVAEVYLKIGFARDVVDELLEGAFRYLARGTVAEGAQLLIERVPFMVRCNHCDLVFHIDVHEESTWVCPLCSAKDYHLESGLEFRIESMAVA